MTFLPARVVRFVFKKCKTTDRDDKDCTSRTVYDELVKTKDGNNELDAEEGMIKT
jgi:hypothetical protein